MVERFFVAMASVSLLNVAFSGAIPVEGRSYNNYSWKEFISHEDLLSFSIALHGRSSFKFNSGANCPGHPVCLGHQRH
jgi:hypothetical protein